jgi:acetylornithine deacetylase
MEFNEQRFIAVLSGLISESRDLQNNPPKHVPKESLAIKHVRAVLDPLSTEHGGKLRVTQVEYHAGRGNLIVEYPGTSNKVET